MEPAGLIARMAAKTPDMDAVGVSSVPGLSEADAAMALAGLDRGPYLLARVKYALDSSSRYPLENQLWGEMCGIATRKKWLIPAGHELLRRMSRMAIEEVVHPAQCPKCGGRGTVYPKGGAARLCSACIGTGRGRVSDRSRAAGADIPKTSWFRIWAPRYELMLAKLDRWDRVAHAHVRQRMKAS